MFHVYSNCSLNVPYFLWAISFLWNTKLKECNSGWILRWGIHSKTPTGCQKVWNVSNPICTVFFLIIVHTSDKVLGFLSDSDGKECTCSVGYLGSILGSGRSPGEGNDNQLQYSCLKNPKDTVGHATVHGVTKSQTWLSTNAHSASLIYKLDTVRD